MSDNRGFAALITKIEEFQRSVERSTERLANQTQQSLRLRTPSEKERQKDKEGKKQTDLLSEVDRTLKRIKNNTWITAKRTEWTLKKVLRPQPTRVEIAEKEYRRATSRQVINQEGAANAAALDKVGEKFLARLEEILDKKKGNLFSNTLKGVGVGVAFPVVSILLGAFKEIGEEFTKDFSKRLAKQAQLTSKINFGDIGADVGQTVGEGLQKGVLDFADTIQEVISAEGKDFAPKLAGLLGKVLGNTLGVLGKSSLTLPRTYQRMQYQRLALPQIKEQAGRLLLERNLTEEQRKSIDQSRSISLVVGGVNMDETAGNTDYVSRLLKPYLKDSHLVPIKNTWSNSSYDPQFKQQFLNLVKTSLNTPILGDMLIKNIKETNQKMGKDSDFADITEEDFADRNKLSEKIIAAAAKKDMPIGKGLEAVFKGYNPDDVQIAAEALYYKQLFPNKPINLVGTSFGGFNTAGASILLKMLGVEGVKGVGVTTPFTGLLTPPDPEDYLGSIGTKDYLYQAVNDVVGDRSLPKDFQQIIEGAGLGHLLPMFIAEPQFKGALQYLLRGRAQVNEGFDQSSFNYFSKRFQNPEDENLIRTAKGLAGLPHEDGYTYTVQELEGYRREINKKGRKATNPQVKKEVEAYLNFLDALSEDLEMFSSLSEFGIKARPSQKMVEAGKQAIEGFPDLPTAPLPEEATELKNQAGSLKNLIAFRKKLRGEVKNFTATLATMKGETPAEGWSFFERGDQKRFEALTGFTSWLENDLLKDASELERNLAQPFLDFMARLQQASQDLEAGGTFDQELETLFNQLFDSSSGLLQTPLQTIVGGADSDLGRRLEVLTNLVQGAVNRAQSPLDQAVANLREAAREATLNRQATTRREQRTNFREQLNLVRRAIEEGDKRLAATAYRQAELWLHTITEGYATLIAAAASSSPNQVRGYRAALTKLINEFNALSPLNNPSSSGSENFLREYQDVFESDPSRLDYPSITDRPPTIYGDPSEGTRLASMEELGQSTVEGFEQQVNEEAGREIGEDFARGVDEGTRDGLDIQSPSKLFEWFGEMVLAGFQNGLRGVDDLLEQFEQTTVEQATNAVSAADQGVADALTNLRAEFSQFFDHLTSRFPVIKHFTDLLLGLGAGLLVGTILEEVVGALNNLANSTFGAVAGFESLQVAFLSISGSAEQATEAMSFVRGEAKRLGVDLKTAEEAYAGILATTRFTSLRGSQTEKIFSVFLETAARRGLTTEQQERFFTAVQQMLSKGKLSAEEVTGQLGDIPALNFKQTLANALGVGGGQFEELMRRGIAASDALPKVAAQYAAENAAVAQTTETAGQAVTRFNNSIVELQRSFQGWIQPLKVVISLGADLVAWVTKAIPLFTELLTTATITLFLNNLAELIENLLNVKTLSSALVNTFKALGSFLQYILPHLLTFARTFVLVSLAVDSVSNVVSIAQGNFQNLQRELEKTRARALALAKAFEEVKATTPQTNKDLPTSRRDLATTKGWNVFGVQTKLNLEGVRNTLGFSTLANQELTDYQEKVGAIVQEVDKTLDGTFKARDYVKEIQELDKALTQVRSRRFNIPAGDKEAYEASLEEESKLLEQRERFLKATATYQQNLLADTETVKLLLKELDDLVARKGITQQAELSVRAVLEGRLKELEQTQGAFEELTSSLERSVNALELALRGLTEQAAFFNESLDRAAAQARAGINLSSLTNGQGSQTRDFELQGVDQRTASARLTFLSDQFEAVNQLLARPDFEAIANELRNQAQQLGLNLENTATLDRLIGEGRSAQETQVLEALKQQLALKDQISQTQEQVAQGAVSLESGFFELGRAVSDFYFNLEQQIKEVTNEITKALERLRYSQIRTQLQRALVPGANSFTNELISQIQGIFEQAASISEQILGQKGARIAFGGEKRGLEAELTNFTRTLGGATEALEAFKRGLLGQQLDQQGGGAPLNLQANIIEKGIQAASKFNAITNACADAVKAFTLAVGINTSAMDSNANSAKAVGKVLTDFSQIKPGDLIGWDKTARHGDEHIGVYLGDKKVFHQSASRGKKPGVYNDFDYFRNQPGAYFVRPNQTSFTPQSVGNSKAISSSYARLTELDALLQKNSKFANTTARMVALIIAAGEAGSGYLKKGSSANLFNFRGGAGNNMQGFAQFNRAYFTAQTSTPEKYTDFLGGILTGQLNLPKGRGRFDPKKLEKAIKDGVIQTEKQLLTYLQQQIPIIDWHGLHESGGGGQRIRESGILGYALNQIKGGAPTLQAQNKPQAQVLGQVSGAPPVDNNQAQKLTQTLIDQKQRQLGVGDAEVRQQVEDFILNLTQTREAITRQLADSLRQTQQSVTDLQNQALDLRGQYAPQTQTNQLNQELRGVDTQYRQLDLQLQEQQRNLTDNLKGLDNLLGQLDPIINLLNQSGSEVDKEQAKFLEGIKAGLSGDKATYQGYLNQINQVRQGLTQGKLDAEAFVKAQAQLRVIEADLERVGLELSIAQGQNNLEREKAIALLQAQKQLELDLLKIQQDYGDNPQEAAARIALAKEQAALTRKQTEYTYQRAKLEQELSVVSRELAISQYGSNLDKQEQLTLLESQKQLELEILEIKNTTTDLARQELEIELARQQARGRDTQTRRDFGQARLDRKGEELEYRSGMAESRAQVFDRVGLTFKADQIRERAALEQEQFRYERERFDLESRYQDNPQVRDKLLEQAALLNSLKVEEINAQYKDFGETLADLSINGLSDFFESWISGSKSAGEAFRDFAKLVLTSIAKMVVQFLVLAVVKAIAGAGGGGKGFSATFSGFPSTPNLVAARTGGLITGPGTGTSDSILARLSNNEFVLSSRAVDNYGEHLLHNLNNNKVPVVDLRGFTGNKASGAPRGQSLTINQTVVTPNADSFQKSDFQRAKETAEMARRALLRL